MAFINKLTSLFILFALIYFAVINYYQDRTYVFKPEVLRKIGSDAAKLNVTSQRRLQYVENQILKQYGPHIDTSGKWILNIAGGSSLNIKILHSSLTEYVILVNSPIETGGFSGRFFSDDYFMLLEGKQTFCYSGSLVKKTYLPGDSNVMKAGTAGIFRLAENSYALEYARGNILFMLPFGIASFFSTLDFRMLFDTFYEFGRHTTNQLLIGKI